MHSGSVLFQAFYWYFIFLSVCKLVGLYNKPIIDEFTTWANLINENNDFEKLAKFKKNFV